MYLALDKAAKDQLLIDQRRNERSARRDKISQCMLSSNSLTAYEKRIINFDNSFSEVKMKKWLCDIS